MDDEARIDELFDKVRSLTPPPGARERVYGRLHAGNRQARRAAPSRRRGPVLALGGAFAVAAVALLVLLLPREKAALAVAFARGAVFEDGSHVGETLPVGARVAVREGGTLRVSTRSGQVTLENQGTASFDLDAVRLHSGACMVEGDVRVDGPGCSIDVDGRAHVSVGQAEVSVTVYAGSIYQREPSVACRVIELSRPDAEHPAKPRAAPRPKTRGEPADTVDTRLEDTDARNPEPEPAPVHVAHPARRGAHETPSELKQQVEAYGAAKALRGVDDSEALAHWRALRKRWPRTTLRHEVDLNIVETLVRLGRIEDARREGRAFLRRYPTSPRAAEIRSLVHGDGGTP